MSEPYPSTSSDLGAFTAATTASGDGYSPLESGLSKISSLGFSAGRAASDGACARTSHWWRWDYIRWNIQGIRKISCYTRFMRKQRERERESGSVVLWASKKSAGRFGTAWKFGRRGGVCVPWLSGSGIYDNQWQAESPLRQVSGRRREGSCGHLLINAVEFHSLSLFAYVQKWLNTTLTSLDDGLCRERKEGVHRKWNGAAPLRQQHRLQSAKALFSILDFKRQWNCKKVEAKSKDLNTKFSADSRSWFAETFFGSCYLIQAFTLCLRSCLRGLGYRAWQNAMEVHLVIFWGIDHNFCRRFLAVMHGASMLLALFESWDEQVPTFANIYQVVSVVGFATQIETLGDIYK